MNKNIDSKEFKLEEFKNKDDLLDFINSIESTNNDIKEKARIRQNNLIKPIGSLGVLEEISIKISGITGKIENNLSKRILFLFGADNGIYDAGVSGSPQYFTKELMLYYAQGYGTGINSISSKYNTLLKIINMGVKGNLDHPNIHNINLMENGTNNFLIKKAMPEYKMIRAIATGISLAKYALENGFHILGGGEVGMGNTTTSTACILSLMKVDDQTFIGKGGGLTDIQYENKKRAIFEGINKYNLYNTDPLDVLSSVGGLDIAGLVGLYIGAAKYKLPVVLDGVISVSAALIAYKLNNSVKEYMFASHRSLEASYSLAINEIGLNPILELNMRLGEGTGCPIAMDIIDTACNVLEKMNTFDDIKLEKEYRKNLKNS